MGSNIDVSSTGALVNRLMNPPNPMQQLQQTVEGVNALKSFQANQASADAYRQSVDPVTGEVDLGKYKALMSQGPGAWNFGPQTQQAGQAVGAVGQGTTADVNSKLTQLGAIAQMTHPLLQQGAATQSIDPAAVQAQLDQAHKTGLVTDAQYSAWSGQLKGMTPQQAYGFVLGGAIGNDEQMRQLGGNVAVINRGPVTQPVQISPFGAQPQPSATVSMGLTPEGALKLQSYLAEPYDYVDRQGVEHRGGTKADFFHDNGINPFAAYTDGTIPAPGSMPTIPASAAPSGGVPPGRLRAPPATAPAPAPPASTTTGPTAALPADQLKAGQDAYKQAQIDANNMADRIAPLRSALGLLRTNADLQTGPGQQQYAQAITGIAAALNLKVPQGSTDLQELTKFLAQNIRAQQTGGTTDLGRLETEASNPNPNTQSRDALQVLLAKTLGTTRLQNAAFDYFNAKYGDPATASTNSGRYNIETSSWKKNQDPTAYAIDELAPDQVQRYFNGLSGSFDPTSGKATGAKAQFVQSMRDAKRLYNLQSGTAGPAPPPVPAPTPTPAPTVAPPPAASPAPGYLTPQQMYGGG